MPDSPVRKVIDHVRRVVLRRGADARTDGQLLGQFVRDRDEASFEALVRRHGPMVLGVCRRILRDGHDAEDAFQATFLILARKAAAVRPRDAVGNWLHGVAYHIAIKARAAAVKRRGRERQVPVMPEPEPPRPDLWEELRPVLDREVSRLPAKYRLPVVLCDLEDRARKEVARQLQIPEGTLSSRLTAARRLLARRLARHGLAVSGGAAATLLSRNAASACVPASLVNSTVRFATLFASGQPAEGVIPPRVAALTEGVLKTMWLTRLKLATAAFLLVALACCGASVLAHQALAAGQPRPAQEPARGKENKAADPPRSAPPRSLAEYVSPVLCVTWSANGRWLAAGTKDGTVHVAEAATGKEAHRFPTNNPVIALAFSPDGKMLAVSQPDSAVTIWDVGTGRRDVRFGTTRASKASEHVAFAPDGQSVVGVGVGHFLQVGRDGGGVSAMAPLQGFSAVAPDGLVSGWCDTHGLLRLRPTSRGNQFAFGNPLTLQVGNARSLAFAPGGKLLAVGGDDKDVQLWDLDQNKPTRVLTGLEKPAANLTFSADGKTLVALADDGTSFRAWDLARGTTRCRINHNRGAVGALALSPDGKLLATAAKEGKALFLWNLDARQLARTGTPIKLSAKEMAVLWNDLAGADADKADDAWSKLGAAGDTALPFLRQRIRSAVVPAVDVKALEKLVADLDSAKFTTREKAAQELQAAGEVAIVLLQRCLEKSPSVEVQRRATLVLKKIGEPTLTPERLRVLDALELLERLRTAGAVALLEEIERDALIPHIRQEAGWALQRVAQARKDKQ
jgi:RNA polymerase sigma factor (sigma-70 family)